MVKESKESVQGHALSHFLKSPFFFGLLSIISSASGFPRELTQLVGIRSSNSKPIHQDRCANKMNSFPKIKIHSRYSDIFGWDFFFLISATWHDN